MLMKKIQEGSQEEKRVYNLLVDINEMIQMEKSNIVLTAIRINTVEKLEALEKFVESKTEGDTLTINEIQLMNEVSRIGRMK